MPADATWKQGDSHPPFQYECTNPDGSSPNLTGATVQFVLRQGTALTSVPVTGSTVVTSSTEPATVQYTPTAGDTAVAGGYMGSFVATFTDGSTQTFPDPGYLWIEIEENLSTAGGQVLVGLPDVKDQLNLASSQRVGDERLLRWVNAITPLIEQIVGPVIVRQFDEWYDGGNTYIKLRRRPSTALGTSPVLTLQACSEYNGPIEWPLAIIASPDMGQAYSCQLDKRRGRVIRRTAGGAVQPFPGPMAQSVHAVYTAGQSLVPANVQEAAIETVRVYHQTTTAIGRGARTRADELDSGPQIARVLPPSAMRLLAPMRRHPSIA